MAAELVITQVRSLSGTKIGQRRTVRALGLRKLHQTVTLPDRPEIRGMVAKVAHLLEVRYAGSEEAVEIEPGQEPKGAGNPAGAPSVSDEEAAEIVEAVEEALSVEGQVGDVADLVQNPPTLATTDTPNKPKVRGFGDDADDDADDAPVAAPAPAASDDEASPDTSDED